MPVNRYFLDAALENSQEVELEGSEFHHMRHVARAAQGDFVELLDGKGRLAKASVQKIEKRRAILQVRDVFFRDKPSFELILAQALPRANRLDNILEKSCELGVKQIWLFPGVLSENKLLKADRLTRLQSILIAAMKQSGRLHLPKIVLKPSLSEWKTFPYPSFFGDLRQEAPLFGEVWKRKKQDSGAVFFVGPESGWDEKETERFSASRVLGVKLHGNILRTDTAPIVALSLIQHWLLMDGASSK